MAASSSSTISRVLPPVSTAGIPPDLCLEMYNAMTEGDLAAVESLLGRDGSLAWRALTEEGEKALHVACSKKHAQLVARLMACLSADEVTSYDGRGYTACCYAAMCGGDEMVEAVRSMVEPYPALLTLQSWYGTDPCMLAVEHGSIEIVSYLTGLDALTEARWFDLLLLAIDNKNFDSALAILEKKGGLAEMKREDDQRTPLHMLAQLDISTACGRDRLVEMIIDPPLLHDAAKLGNVDLVTLILHGHPHLMFRTDADGRSLLHTIVMSRRPKMLPLVERARRANGFKILDKDRNNLLHCAAKSLEKEDNLRAAYWWFEKVKLVVPPELQEMRNINGDVPAQLFWKEHRALVAEKEAYTKKRAESSMLITTVVLTLVFGSAFAPPGGYNEQTGIPILLHEPAFTSFMICVFMALSSAAISLLGFLHIVTSKRKNYYQAFVMPSVLSFSMISMAFTVSFATGAFLSAFFLEFIKKSSPIAHLKLLIPVVFAFGVLFLTYKQALESDRKPKVDGDDVA